MSLLRAASTACAVLVSLASTLAACGPSIPENVADVPSPTASATASTAPTGSARQAPASRIPASIQAVLDAADRSADDRAIDAGRHPVETLKFFGVAPGMKVAELAAGGGYTAELLARTVGAGGVVYGQNSKFILDRFAEKPWSERLGQADHEERRPRRSRVRRPAPARGR